MKTPSADPAVAANSGARGARITMSMHTDNNYCRNIPEIVWPKRQGAVRTLAGWFLIALSAMEGLAGTAEFDASEQAPVASFKHFMSVNPPAGMIVFSVTFANGQERFYDYRWDNESFTVREFDDLTQVFATEPDLNALVAGGRDGTMYWRLRSSQVIGPNLLEWDSNAGSRTNQVWLTVDSLLFNPQVVLCMGLMHSKPGTMRWNGDQFDSIETEQHIKGSISTSMDRRVSEMKVTRTSDKVRRYLISYEYGEGNKPGWMPDTIQLHLIEAKEQTRKLQRYKILHASFEQPSAEGLRPASIIQDRVIVTGFLSNNDTYFSRGGQTKRLLRPEEVPAFNNVKLKPKRGTWHLLLGVAALAVGAIFATEVWLGRQQRTHDSRQR